MAWGTVLEHVQQYLLDFCIDDKHVGQIVVEFTDYLDMAKIVFLLQVVVLSGKLD